MDQMKPGDEIGIRCEVTKGPFSGEHLISFETVDGPVSGFVRESELKTENKVWFVRAEVLRLLADDIVEVRVQGSFFTTNGIATIPREMALAA
jgi:hypothetical protein